MTKLPKGYEDPWRIGQAKKDEPEKSKPEVPQGMIGTMDSNHPMDADLIPHKEYPLRCPGASGALLIHGAESMEGAARILVAQVAAHPNIMKLLEQEGFVLEPHEGKAKGYYLTDQKHRLRHPEAQSTRDGFNRLLRALRRGVIYVSGFRELIYKVGIIPLLQ